MNHSINLSGNELDIINRIARSSNPISAYELSLATGKNYKTIHTACKKLIGAGILVSMRETNNKNAPKNVLRFTLYGFCLFIAKSELFIDTDNRLKIYDLADQLHILHQWKHLHECFGWIYSLVLKMPKHDNGHVVFILGRLHMICRQITNDAVLRTYILSEKIYRERTNAEISEMVDSQLYRVMFSNVFGFYILSSNFFEIPLDELVGVIKNSEKGQPKIKEYLKSQFADYEMLKKIDQLL